MALTATPVFPQTPQCWPAAILNATGAFTFAAASNSTTNLVSLVPGGTNGALVEALNITSTDSSSHVIDFILNNGVYNFLLFSYLIGSSQGFGGNTGMTKLMNNTYSPYWPQDSNGNYYIYIPSGSTLYVGSESSVTAAKQLSVYAIGGAF